jgi:hypothetical protein
MSPRGTTESLCVVSGDKSLWVGERLWVVVTHNHRSLTNDDRFLRDELIDASFRINPELDCLRILASCAQVFSEGFALGIAAATTAQTSTATTLTEEEGPVPTTTAPAATTDQAAAPTAAASAWSWVRGKWNAMLYSLGSLESPSG